MDRLMMEDLYSKATSTCQHRVSNSVLAKMGKLRAVDFRVKRHLEAPLKKSIVATSIRGRSQPKRKWQAAILNRLAQCGSTNPPAWCRYVGSGVVSGPPSFFF
ncbi:unnamed protein product [Ixodes persulcatus]